MLMWLKTRCWCNRGTSEGYNNRNKAPEQHKTNAVNTRNSRAALLFVMVAVLIDIAGTTH